MVVVEKVDTTAAVNQHAPRVQFGRGGVVLCIYKFPFSIINTSSFPPSFTIFNNCQSLHTLQRKKIADERDASRKNPRRSRRGGGTDSVEAEPLLELK